MLRIRQEQMAAFSSRSETDFADRLLAFLRSQFDDAAAVPDDVLRPAIVDEAQKAEKYGMRSQQQIATYVVTAWLLGADFDTEFPAAHDVLIGTETSADDKADWLARWTEAMFSTLENGS